LGRAAVIERKVTQALELIPQFRFLILILILIE